jgi:hypothetical protein
MKTQILSKEELLDLLASCNNVIMRGLYSGDDMLDASSLMQDLQHLHEALRNEDE